MTRDAPSEAPSPFETHANGGLAPAFHRRRTRRKPSGDAFADAPDLLAAFRVSDSRSNSLHGRQEDVEASIGAVTEGLADRRLLFEVLHAPLGLVEHVGKGFGPAQQWIIWCRTTEALWSLLSDDGAAESPLSPTERALLRPIAARQRFIALSEGFRRAEAGPASPFPWKHRFKATLNVFGHDKRHVFVERAVQARWDWLEYLDSYQSHPAFSAADPGEIEEEIGFVLLDGDRPLLLSTRALKEKEPVPPDTADAEVVRDVAERHLLPRFQVWQTMRVSTAAITSGTPRAGRAMAAAVAALAAVALLCTAVAALFPSATGWPVWPAAACYLTGAAGVLVFGRMWALPWLLRMPAAAAIGLFMVVSLHPTWWQSAFPGVDTNAARPCAAAQVSWAPLAGVAVLAVAAFAYLMVTARNNGLPRRTTLLRSSGVWGIGACHALLVSVIGLNWMVPYFSEEGSFLLSCWNDAPQGSFINIAQATAWCLAAGVFSQMLWDDRPITAPLSHTRWRREK